MNKTQKLIYLFLCIFALNVTSSAFATFNAVENLQLFVPKGDQVTFYSGEDQKTVIAIIPKGNMDYRNAFIGHRINGADRPGYKFLVSRSKYGLMGLAKESEIKQIPLPSDKYELFQLLLDDYNKLQSIDIGGTYGAVIVGNGEEPATVGIYVHAIFDDAAMAAKQQYAKEMYALWKACNPGTPHLTVKFIQRSITKGNKVILVITDGVVKAN